MAYRRGKQLERRAEELEAKFIKRNPALYSRISTKLSRSIPIQEEVNEDYKPVKSSQIMSSKSLNGEIKPSQIQEKKVTKILKRKSSINKINENNSDLSLRNLWRMLD